MNDQSNSPLERSRYDSIIDSWDHTEQPVIDRIEGSDCLEMKQKLEQRAHTNLAFQRCDLLTAIATTTWNPAIKHLLTGAVGLFGAMVVGTSVGSIVDSTGRGPLAAVGGAIAGGTCAVLTDVYASSYMMKRRMRYNSSQALKRLQAEFADYPQPTEFEIHYYTSQQQLLQQVETLYLVEEPKSEEWMAICAICTEGIVSLVLTLPAGLPLALASATFPIITNLLVAKVQSDRFEVPEACEQLIPTYEVHIPAETISPQEALEVERLHAALQYVAQARPPKGLHSVGQAKALTQIKFAQNRIAVLEEDGVLTIIEREQQYQLDLSTLSERCPTPEIDVGGLTAQQVRQAEQEWCDQWLTKEKYTLIDQLKRDLEQLKAQYGQAIHYWRNVENQGIQEYQDNEPDKGMSRAA